MSQNMFHEIDQHPTRKGCSGFGQCSSCDRHLMDAVMGMKQTGKLEAGCGYELPHHILLMWEDGTFTTMPKIPASLN